MLGPLPPLTLCYPPRPSRARLLPSSVLQWVRGGGAPLPLPSLLLPLLRGPSMGSRGPQPGWRLVAQLPAAVGVAAARRRCGLGCTKRGRGVGCERRWGAGGRVTGQTVYGVRSLSGAAARR